MGDWYTVLWAILLIPGYVPLCSYGRTVHILLYPVRGVLIPRYPCWLVVVVAGYGYLDIVLKVDGADIAWPVYRLLRLYDAACILRLLTVRLYTYG